MALFAQVILRMILQILIAGRIQMKYLMAYLLEAHAPLVFVTFMTFTLILSSVTMVRAVQEGHAMNRKGVLFWLGWTILGGLVFVGSQAFEWTHLIHEGMNLKGNPFGAQSFGQLFL